MIPRALIVLMFLAVSAQGSINVDIVASKKDNDRQINLSGTNVAIISNEEMETFNLTDDSLKNAIKAYSGSAPNDVFLKSPTPWGDLYKVYGWSEVRTVLTPIKARILGVQSESSVVFTRIFNNNSTKKTTIHAKIQKNVQNSVKSTWRKGGSINTNQTIQYNFDIKVAASVSGKTSFSYTSQWGESVDKTETVTVGSESGVEINLGPNESVVAELYATRGTIKIEIDYEASLKGSTAVNYSNGYKAHHHWSFDINSVMSAGGLKRTIKSTETITLGYYTDSEVILKNLKTLTGPALGR